MKSFTSALILITVFAVSSHTQRPTLNMTIFYETLCPYSMSFFRNQLGPVWEKLGGFINVELVPYGHATQTYQNGTWHFNCQHGENECNYNIYHSCIIKKVYDMNRVVRTLTCLMATKRVDQLFDSCLGRNEINDYTKNEIKSCIDGDEGKELLSGYGNRTNNYNPPVKYVPTEVFNEVFDDEARIDAFYDLKEVICRFLHPKPQECGNLYYMFTEK